jgi:tetratricopeptide (TPR) repeat protein
MTKLRNENLVMLGARLGGENPLPRFRDPAINRKVKGDPFLPEQKTDRLGWETGFRVLPYRMQDNYGRERTPLSFRSIILENEILKATFLPELGGRLISLLYKPDQRELLSRNPVFQPANLAIRNAWFSGGVEWNIGQLGHTFSTCSPVFAASITGAQGEPGLRLYDFERCKQIFWQIDFYLPPGSPWLIAFTRILNPNDAGVSTYWWTNTALAESTDVRVLAPASKALFTNVSGGSTYDLSQGDLPYLPPLSGPDATYPLNSNFANEFFFQCDETDFPWETALDKDGCGLIEASTSRLRYRKLFCWGYHQGGRHWQEFLSPGGKPYIEIQAGLAPTQLHGLNMPARANWDWTQIFGFIQAEPVNVHGEDWNIAWKTVDAVLRSRMTPEKLSEIEANCRARASLPGEKILQSASGWGALEIARRNHVSASDPIPSAFVFPKSSLGVEQAKWLHLLHKDHLPEQPPEAEPGEWMVQAEWRDLLEASLKRPNDRNWFALLHLGTMRMEKFDYKGAKNAWLESVTMKPSSWAWRNLAQVALRRGEDAEALSCLSHAWELSMASGYCPSLAQEYLSALCTSQYYDAARVVYDSLPEMLKDNDRIQILHARIALELGDLDTVEKLMQHEYAVVREGETELTDIWFEIYYRRHRAGNPNELLDDKTRLRIRHINPPPASIDFRSCADDHRE